MAVLPYADFLTGEQPPSAEDIGRLWKVSLRILELEPWNHLHESNLLGVEAVPGRIFWAEPMGSLGEVVRIHFFEGAQGYWLVHDIAGNRIAHASEMFSRTFQMYVDFERTADVEKPDREALALAGLKVRRGRTPTWRVARRNSLPWYPSADEAKLLSAALDLSLEFYEGCLAPDGPYRKAFARSRRVPVIDSDRTVKFQPVPTDAPPPVDVPAVDAKTIRALMKLEIQRYGLEVDAFTVPMPVGKKAERPILPSMAVCVTSDGYAHAPHLEEGGAERGKQLAGALINAIAATGARPAEIRVKSSEDAEAIRPFCERIGAVVTVHRLRATEQFKAAMFQHFGR